MNARKILAKAYLWLLILVLYAPIAFIVIFSFTEAKSLGNWTGFSTQLYGNLFSGSMQNASGLQSAVINTLLIALVASIFATLLGTVAAIGIHHLSGRKKRTMTFLNNIPMINPDIITGVSLFLLFVFLHFSQGYLTVILAHVTFGTPYVVLSVMPRLQQMNPNTCANLRHQRQQIRIICHHRVKRQKHRLAAVMAESPGDGPCPIPVTKQTLACVPITPGRRRHLNMRRNRSHGNLPGPLEIPLHLKHLDRRPLKM